LICVNVITLPQGERVRVEETFHGGHGKRCWLFIVISKYLTRMICVLSFLRGLLVHYGELLIQGSSSEGAFKVISET